MSERDFAMALAMLAEAFGEKRLTEVRIEAYHKGLVDVPLPLLNAAVKRAIETRAWFPKVAELRQDAEAVRKELVAAHPYSADECEQCNHTGWVNIDCSGTIRVRRCVCWRAHVEKLTRLGVTGEPLTLPPARESQDWTAPGDAA